MAITASMSESPKAHLRPVDLSTASRTMPKLPAPSTPVMSYLRKWKQTLDGIGRSKACCLRRSTFASGMLPDASLHGLDGELAHHTPGCFDRLLSDAYCGPDFYPDFYPEA